MECLHRHCQISQIWRETKHGPCPQRDLKFFFGIGWWHQALNKYWVNGTLDGKKWCSFGEFVCYLVSHYTKWVQTPWQNLSLLFSSSLRKEGCGCCQSASFSAEKHYPLNLSGELFSGIHSCLENRQGTLRKFFKMSNFNLSLVSVFYLPTRFELIFKKFSIYRPLTTVCIDFHLGEISQQCLYVMKVTLTCFFPRKTVNEMAGCWF